MKIPFTKPDIGEAEIKKVVEVLKSGWITTGPVTKAFEKDLALYCESPGNCVCLSSQTAAAETVMRFWGIQAGDEVICPAYTYTATAAAAIHCGAKPVFVDSYKIETGKAPIIDAEAIAAAFSEKTKAVIPVDIGGVAADYAKIFEIAEGSKAKFKAANQMQEALGRVLILADAAHSLGSRYRNKAVGSVADFSCFSFHAVKNLTTAEGGAAIWRPELAAEIKMSDDDIYRRLQLLSLHGQSKDALAKTRAGAWEYDIVEPWYKCNMSDVHAAIGYSQLQRYEDILKKRRKICRAYADLADELNLKYLRHFDNNENRSSCHLFILYLPGAGEAKRNRLIENLADRGISANVHYKPLPLMTAYKKRNYKIEDYQAAYDFYQNSLSLPLYSTMTEEECSYVCENLRDAIIKSEPNN